MYECIFIVRENTIQLDPRARDALLNTRNNLFLNARDAAWRSI